MHLGQVAALGRLFRGWRRFGRLLGRSLGLFGEIDGAPPSRHREFVDRCGEGAHSRFLFRFGDGAGFALARRFRRDASVAQLIADKLTQVADDVIGHLGCPGALGENGGGQRDHVSGPIRRR